MMSNSDFRHLIEVRPSPGKGQGTFAKTDISKGTRILAEQGLLGLYGIPATFRDVIQAFERLSKPKQEEYLTLHAFTNKDASHAKMEDGTVIKLSPLHSRVCEIWNANSWGDVYVLGSRFNHSCIPNVNAIYNDKIKGMTFHVVRDIKANEEHLVMYNKGTDKPRELRQQELERFGFICNCPACEDTPFGRKKEERRAQLYNFS